MHSKIRSGGKPPFPTFETFKLERQAFKHECLTGQEGLLSALALPIFTAYCPE
jgi:hypothetical protein